MLLALEATEETVDMRFIARQEVVSTPSLPS